MANFSQITVKDYLESFYKHIRSSLSQNTTPAANAVRSKTSSADTPTKAKSGGNEQNAIHDIMAYISYPTLERLHDKHIVIIKVGNSDVTAEYKSLYKINQH